MNQKMNRKTNHIKKPTKHISKINLLEQKNTVEEENPHGLEYFNFDIYNTGKNKVKPKFDNSRPTYKEIEKRFQENQPRPQINKPRTTFKETVIPFQERNNQFLKQQKYPKSIKDQYYKELKMQSIAKNTRTDPKQVNEGLDQKDLSYNILKDVEKYKNRSIQDVELKKIYRITLTPKQRQIRIFQKLIQSTRFTKH